MKATTDCTAYAAVSAPGPLYNRTLPDAEPNATDKADPVNLIFIVGMALVITVLARYLSTRGHKK